VDLASVESPGTEAALLIQRLETDLKLDQSISQARINRVGLIILEPANPALQAGLQIGALEIHQSDNPITAGLNLTGNYIGIMFRSNLYHGNHTAIRLDGGYTYNEVDKHTNDQVINYDWHEFLLRALFEWKFADFNMSLGGYTQIIDGDETAFGVVTRTREFEQVDKTGARLEVDYRVDVTGKIGIQLDNGGRDAVALIFAREF
jgi:hypothetical protein